MARKTGFYTEKASDAKEFADEWVQAPKRSRNSGSKIASIAKAGAVIGVGAVITSMIANATAKNR